MLNKEYGISFARLIATLAIVGCHIFQFYGSQLAWWLNGGVNVFLIISGFLYGKREYKFKNSKEWFSFTGKFYYKEFIKILIPLFVHLLFAFPVYHFLGTSLKEYVILFSLRNPNISGFGYMWFFKYIIVCYLFLSFYYLLYDLLLNDYFL